MALFQPARRRRYCKSPASESSKPEPISRTIVPCESELIMKSSLTVVSPAGSASMSTLKLQGGDSVYVPRADQYYIYGEVTSPNMYRLEPGMTVIEAVARAGGVTVRGSERRIDIKRAGKDGKYVVIHAKPDDHIAADDVIRVKEAIF